MLVIVANDPSLYRRTLSETFRGLRPHVEVLAVDPSDLDSEVTRLGPNVVICSALTEAVQTRVLAWVLLYPGGESHAVIGLDSEQVTMETVELDDLLGVIDGTQRLIQGRSPHK